MSRSTWTTESAFVDAWLLRACATLGIKLTHSTPGRPQGTGKIERVFRTVREQFLVEITGTDDDQPGRHLVTELNRLLTAWVETVYHRRVHTETAAPPLARWMTGDPLALPTPAAPAEAFLWEQRRTVTKTATVSLHGNIYLPHPTVGVRGIHHQIVATLGGQPLVHHAPLVPQTADALATEQAEHGRTLSVPSDRRIGKILTSGSHPRRPRVRGA